MIDAEVKIFNRVHAVVAPLCAKGKFVSKYVVNPTAFPAASLVEMDNSTVRNRQSSSTDENYALITYKLDVYAKTKSKCREVFAAADNAMLKLNFSRMSGQFIDNAEHQDIFRYVARYEAVIDREGQLYRRN